MPFFSINVKWNKSEHWIFPVKLLYNIVKCDQIQGESPFTNNRNSLITTAKP